MTTGLSLREALQAYVRPIVESIAQNLKLELPSSYVRKSELIDLLCQAVEDGTAVRTALEMLDPVARAILALLATNEGVASLSQLAQRFLMTEAAQQMRKEISPSQPLLVSEVVYLLLRLGLVVGLREQTGSYVHSLDIIPFAVGVPKEVMAVPAVASLAPPPQASNPQLVDLPETGQIVPGDPTPILRQLLFLWHELRRQPAKLLRDGSLGKRESRRLAQALALDETTGMERVATLYALLQALGMVEVDTAAQLARAWEDPGVMQIWTSGPAAQIEAIIRAYSTLEGSPDRIPSADLKQWYKRRYIHHSMSILRQRVISLLLEMQGVGWLSVDQIVSLLNEEHTGGLLLEAGTRESLLENASKGTGWAYVLGELRVIEYTIVEALLQEQHRLGLLDAFYHDAEAQALYAVRISDAVRQFEESPPTSVSAGWSVVLQPDFQVLALGPTPSSVLATIEGFTERESVDPSVVTYRITHESTYGAFQRGETADTLLAQLSELTHAEPPQNVRRSLEAWYAQYERIVVHRQVTILHVDSPALLEALMRDPELARHVHPIDATTAWFHPSAAGVIEARLMEHGHLAAKVKDIVEARRESVRWQGDELESVRAAPGLGAIGTLARFAERVSEGHWRLTPERVQRAAGLGIDANIIARWLEELTGASLPSRWRTRLRAWTGYFGQARVAHVRLLQFENATALDELRSLDPRLKRWLRPLPDAPGYATVADTHWDELQHILGELGIALDTEGEA